MIEGQSKETDFKGTYMRVFVIRSDDGAHVEFMQFTQLCSNRAFPYQH